MAVNEDIEITIESEPSQFTELEVIPIYGPTGNGISRIEKTDTSYNVDTYTIYFTNGTTTTFTVTNGVSILDIQKTDTTGLVDTYTISLSDGNTHTFTVTNGAGISNIAKTSTSGLVDTYTVTLNNSDSYTFTVTNGKAGTIEIGTVTTGAAGSSASVTNVGTDNEAILNFVIPKGDKGDKGDTGTAATISVGTTTTGAAGSSASVTNSGTSSAAVLNFTIPKGDKGNTGNTGATGNGVSGTSLLSWEGLVKTYRISYTNGSYFDYTVENGTGQVDWGGISGVISQQTDLQDVLHSSKGYLDNGTLLTDTTLYNYVYGYNHSTFDISKFTVVGSPIITDDGIASGFSGSTAIETTYLNNLNSANTWQIKFFVDTPATYKPNNGMLGTSQSVDLRFQCSPLIRMNENGNFQLLMSSDGTTWDIANNILTTDVFPTSTRVGIRLKFTGTQYLFYTKLPNADWKKQIEINNSNKVYSSNTSLLFGNAFKNDANQYFTGTIDLSSISITVNGYPIFSGTKTGIDTIKPDDYTVVGTPTISTDGIASGFSSSDYIKTSTISYLNNFTLILKIRTPNTTPTATEGLWVEDTSTTYRSRMGLTTAMKLNMFLTSNGASWDIGEKTEHSKILALNTEYIIKLEFNGATYKVYLSEDNGNTYVELTGLSMTSTAKLRDLPIRLGQHLNTSPFNGSIDLNSFKIYVNGNLVYQPCLLIPYNESSTGSKIVDVAYRDRVIDVYNQFGSANYYTIDETNKNVTLPMGELYGLIGQRTLRASYRNGINYWEEYSDRTLEQGGSCTSGTTVNLLKPFADTNYVLTVPYSAKTTTSFTPSASGDWIAKGLGE